MTTPLPAFREPPRLLALHSEHGYTENPTRALPEEPEAISEAYQRFLVRQSKRAEAARRREVWDESRATLLREIAVCTAALGADVLDELRTIERAVGRIERRVSLA